MHAAFPRRIQLCPAEPGHCGRSLGSMNSPPKSARGGHDRRFPKASSQSTAEEAPTKFWLSTSSANGKPPVRPRGWDARPPCAAAGEREVPARTVQATQTAYRRGGHSRNSLLATSRGALAADNAVRLVGMAYCAYTVGMRSIIATNVFGRCDQPGGVVSTLSAHDCHKPPEQEKIRQRLPRRPAERERPSSSTAIAQ